MVEQIKKWFMIAERGSDFRTESIAGLTTFVAMMYIVIVNPTMLSQGGIDFGGAYIATIIAVIIGTLIMGGVANYPIAIAPGIGINAYFVFVVILSHGVPWQEALGASFVASAIFLLLSVTRFRQMLLDAIPESLKTAIAVGIGMFIAVIGMENGRLIVGSPTTITTLGELSDPVAYLTLIGLAITLILMAYKVKSSIFLGMIAVACISVAGGYIELPAAPFAFPTGLDKTFCQMSFENIFSADQLLVIFTVLLVTLFDTTGTMLGVGKQAGLIKKGEFPNLQSALLADAVASFFGSIFGTGPTSSYVESGAGVAAGGRTGFASIVTAFLFLLMLFCVPLAKAFSSMPAVTAPALIIVGFLMMMDVRSINWDYIPEAFPSFVTVMVMPLSYSITTGVGAGFILYVVLNFCAGRRREIHPLMYIFALLFFLQFTIMKL